MATVKTYDELVTVIHTLYRIEEQHVHANHPHYKRGQWCAASVCILCGYTRFACQAHWKDDCICDACDGRRKG